LQFALYFIKCTILPCNTLPCANFGAKQRNVGRSRRKVTYNIKMCQCKINGCCATKAWSHQHHGPFYIHFPSLCTQREIKNFNQKPMYKSLSHTNRDFTMQNYMHMVLITPLKEKVHFTVVIYDYK
jgi:hypothetical protein